VRFITSSHAPVDERLLWSRDIRYVHRLASRVPGSRVIEMDAGTVLIAPADMLSERVASIIADETNALEYGLATIDSSLPERDRYLVAMASAVQLSGLASRIGMAPSTQVVQTKMLDYFFSLRKLHRVAFQPIVEIATGQPYEYECLFRPDMPMLPQSIGSVVQAAISTDRGVELDTYITATILERIGAIEATARKAGRQANHYAINLMPSTLLHPTFEASRMVEMVRAAELDPRQITIECTEQQAVPDVKMLRQQVRRLRRLGFGFAVDDAGAGYASFALIAALKPSVIKIDRDIVHGIGRDDAKQALVEAFVSFGRRIGARLLAEGIERRTDLTTLSTLNVELGQGYLLGKPAPDPMPPRRLDRVPKRISAAAAAATAAAATTAPHKRAARVPSRA
jgi:EAL domain-containing protein (putative c-di-GMP-specific phosphodiesterase class I)